MRAVFSPVSAIAVVGGLLAGTHDRGLAVPALAGERPVTVAATVLDVPAVTDNGSIRFHALLDSTTGERPSEAGAASPTTRSTQLLADDFDAGRRLEWHDALGTTGAERGKLAAASPRNDVVLRGVTAHDVAVSVDAEAATQMGILLRYRDPGNFVLAFYAPGAKILGFHEVVDGRLGPWIRPVSTAGLTGKAMHMAAEIRGSVAKATITDEQGHRAHTRAVMSRSAAPGSLGLYHDASSPGTQRFDNFRAHRFEIALPPDAVEVLLAPSQGGEDSVWAVGRRVQITGAEHMARPGGAERGTLRVGSVAQIVPLVERDADRTLFPCHALGKHWIGFSAHGFGQQPACGVIYRTGDEVANGMPLGGIDTGCVDLETSGMLGYSTLFNTHVPRRGPLNVPILGLSVAGRTWLLCDPQPKDGAGGYQPSSSAQKYTLWRNGKYEQATDLLTPVPMDVHYQGLHTAQEIHYWGHYPVADLEFQTDAPIGVGLRAWAPFFPGNVVDSMLPGIVFEVHLRNVGRAPQEGTIAFSFPGPLDREAGAGEFQRTQIEGEFRGVEVTAPLASYALGLIGQGDLRLGGELGGDPARWAGIARDLPAADAARSGSSAAVDFTLAPGEDRAVRFAVTWFAPQWNAGGYNWAGAANRFTHMYAKHYPSARRAAEILAKNHGAYLRRILAWQRVIFAEPELPVWLRDSLVNNLHLITETGMWAQAKPPLPAWVRPDDGLFGMNECPRGCPQIECIPCSFYGNQPLVYFFPQLALSTLRGYKGYQFPDGAAVWVFGGCTGQTPPIDFANPTKGYQFATNGISLAAMVDRYWLCHGRKQPSFVGEFLPIVKQNTTYTVNLRPAYALGDRIIAMPAGNQGTEWFEAPEPGWRGMTAHVGGLHLAQLRIAQRLARLAGDTAFEKQCAEWVAAGARSMDQHLWTGSYWLNYLEPETKSRSDLVFGYQLDGEWVTDHHGLPSALAEDRVRKTLATIKRTNVAVTKYGAVNYANPDGTPAKVGGYGTYSYFPPEALMLAMNFMYEGEREFGLQLARKVWHNIVCTQGYTWDMPNIMRGDVDTGERTYGNDYYQHMMLWSLPAALAGKDFGVPTQSGGLVDRVIDAASR